MKKTTTSNEDAVTARRLIPVTEWQKYYPRPGEGGLRHLIFFGDSTGFNKVVRRVGRRVLIDEAAFFEYVDAQNGGRRD